ncbi:unnamed protein product [Trifolium pratense]|uniref:Uncharacterized protein n=1 Tax=Trifolium pratense TaxID=57577 RepID=A0ACB0KKL6_TRIPR|nr:unnamed protein product [Trifolium pratense]
MLVFLTKVRRHVVSCLNGAKERQGLDRRVSLLQLQVCLRYLLKKETKLLICLTKKVNQKRLWLGRLIEIANQERSKSATSMIG